MKTIIDILNDRVAAVMGALTGGAAEAAVRPTQDARFGDYQANGVMGLAKQLKTKPRDLAQKIVDQLDVADMCEPPEIAGPGFINFRLKPAWLADRLIETARDEKRLGIDPVENSPTTVVDFSGPNIAKQMHVGHLRSTIIGDVIARTLEFRSGDPKTVIRQNHVGDWGLQMGMVVHAMYETLLNQSVQEYGGHELLKGPLPINEIQITIDELEALYKNINSRIEIDKDLADACREAVVKLQSGDPDTTKLWKKAREVSLNSCFEIYKKLGVNLGIDNIRGESFYNDKLPSVISDLLVANMLQESQGAKCVFLDGFKTKEGEPLPLIVQKTDGAYLYATTDLAAIRYRVGELQAHRIIYVTDARQKLHFEMIFACAWQAGWADKNIRLEHVPFGSVLGEDGKPFKTRSGENVKLKDLLDEAIVRARKVVDEKNPDLDDDKKKEIAAAVGVGAVKYADLSNNLASDYVFDWDKMLAMEGNTAPYMQYAYARIRSIFRKGEVDFDQVIGDVDGIELTEPEELALAKCLLRYGETVETVADDLRPHVMTNYLFDLAQMFSVFYTQCPVLKAADRVRARRLLLCRQTARTIRHGLELLGIETPATM